MGTRTGQSIVDRAWIKAKDDKTVEKRWPKSEALMWVNDWLLALVSEIQRAYVKSAVVTPEPGTRQTLQALGITDAIQLLDIPHNVGPSGSIGSPMTKTKRAFLDEAVPTWHQTQAEEADNWTTDEEDPKAFYIVPAISGGGKLRITYAATPPELASLAGAIPVDDVYANSGQHFVLFSFYSKDLQSLKSAQLAQMHYGLFKEALGIRGQRIELTDAASNKQQQGA